MHRAWLILDVLRNILSRLETTNHKASLRSRALLPLALTSTLLCPHVLDLLWSRVEGGLVARLYRVCEGNRDRESRIREYLLRVRELDLCELDCSASYLDEIASSGGFPLLNSLVLKARTPEFIRSSANLFEQSLHVLRLYFAFNSKSDAVRLEDIYDAMLLLLQRAEEASAVTKLHISFNSVSSPLSLTARRRLLRHLGSWDSLERLTLDIDLFCSEFLTELSRLPRLSFFSITCVDITATTPTEFTRCSCGFSSLLDLEITSSSGLALAIADALPSRPLRDIKLILKPVAGHVFPCEEVITTLLTRSGSSLRELLVISCVHLHIPFSEGSRQPLLLPVIIGVLPSSLKDLRLANIEPDKVTNELCAQLALALPCIEHLILAPSSFTGEVLVTLEGLIPFARHCHQLLSLSLQISAARDHFNFPTLGIVPSSRVTALDLNSSIVKSPMETCAILRHLFPHLRDLSFETEKVGLHRMSDLTSWTECIELLALP